MKTICFVRSMTRLVSVACLLFSGCGGGGGSAPQQPTDTTAPTVSSVSPPSSSLANGANATVTATFSESIDCAKAGATALSISEGSAAVVGTTSCSGNTLKFTPSSVLPTNTTLKATVDTTVADLAGNRLANAYSWNFGLAAWTVQEGSAAADTAGGVAIDSAGNVFLIGLTTGSIDGTPNAGSTDLVLIKYDRFGARQWVRQFGSPAAENAFAITTDNNGNVYIGGATDGSLDPAFPAAASAQGVGSDAFIAKYDGAGTRQWLRQFHSDGTDLVRSLAIDGNGDVVAAGWTSGALFGNYGGTVADMFVVKLDSAGKLLWGNQTGAAVLDVGAGVAVDTQNNVYVNGYINGNLDGSPTVGSYDAFVAKYDSSGKLLWSRAVATDQLDAATKIATSPDGVVMIGRTRGAFSGQASSGGLDTFVAKLDAAGNTQWIRQFGSTLDEYPNGLAVDRNGNIWVTGQTFGAMPGNSSVGKEDAFVTKLDAAGNTLWLRQFGSGASENVGGIAIDSDGNAFIAGDTGGGLDGKVNQGDKDLFIVKYAPDGTKR